MNSHGIAAIYRFEMARWKRTLWQSLITPVITTTLYFVVFGSGTMRIDGDEIELKPGRFVRVDPSATRLPVAGPDGLEFIAFGAPLDAPYEPPPWG